MTKHTPQRTIVALTALAALTIATGGAAVAGNYGTAPSADIVDTAANAGTFKTLLAAADAAGLVDALRGDGPLTIFAPTDEAFAKLPAGTVESLLEPKNLDQLKAILTYHVVSGSYPAAKVVKMASVDTLNGAAAAISVDGSTVKVGGATVTATDIMASNGVIHVIDSVIMPPAKRAAAGSCSGSSGATLTASAH